MKIDTYIAPKLIIEADNQKAVIFFFYPNAGFAGSGQAGGSGKSLEYGWQVMTQDFLILVEQGFTFSGIHYYSVDSGPQFGIGRKTCAAGSANTSHPDFFQGLIHHFYTPVLKGISNLETIYMTYYLLYFEGNLSFFAKYRSFFDI